MKQRDETRRPPPPSTGRADLKKAYEPMNWALDWVAAILAKLTPQTTATTAAIVQCCTVLILKLIHVFENIVCTTFFSKQNEVYTYGLR
jgi:hypothetical protein